MFGHADLKGDGLLPRTLCLTYDDGPGPGTAELGRYLRDEGVRATFFVLGRHAEDRRDLLADLHATGHLIGNHTYTHPGLVAFVLGGGDAADELLRTDALIRPFAGAGPVLFRPPYGNWREKVAPGDDRDQDVSVVAERLNRDGRLAGYVGPVNWDVCAEDWECWRQRLPAEEAARRYVAEVERVGRGIVLMHDDSEDPAIRPGVRTAEATKLMVPELKRRGFRFVGLDEVPSVREAVRRAGMREVRGAHDE
jgi:peptidoglycan/xylan/chitin deacetylase (PgdA/CDA1 family)